MTDLESLFNPRSVAVIGASKSPGKTGTTVLFCMIGGGFRGKIYPINPKEEKILGLEAHKNISEVPDKVDVAIICVPAPSTPQVIKECTEAGVKFGVIISSGFGEVDENGRKLQQEIVRIAREGGMRLVGPNCMGIGSATSSLYASMNFTIPAVGNASIVSQSGTLATLITLAASDRGIGFNKYVSSGNEADLHLEDFLEYYARDPETKIVAAFIEGVREGEKFIRASNEITKSKPFIVLKGGATEAGAGAASSHTGALAGSDTVFDALCKQSGITRVSNNREMINLLQAFSTLPLPKGRKVAVVSAQGGLGVLAADACVKCGLELASLTRETRDDLDAFLPYFWSRKNPVDATGGIADYTILSRALEVLLRQEDIQSVICLAPIFSVIFSTIRPRLSNVVQDAFKSTLIGALGEMEEKVANDFIRLRKRYGKPIVSVGLFAQRGSEGIRLLEEGGIPVYDTPDDAAYVISRLSEYKEYLEGLGETP